MRSAALPQRLVCGPAPRCCRLPQLRLGIRLSVIVPSRDSAPGSSDKRHSPYWLYDEDVASIKAELEKAYSLGEAPDPSAGPLDPQQQHEQHEQQGQQLEEREQQLQRAWASAAAHAPSAAAPGLGLEAAAGGPTLAASEPRGALPEQEEEEYVLLEPQQLRERIASAALAATSAPSSASASASLASSRSSSSRHARAAASVGAGSGAGSSLSYASAAAGAGAGADRAGASWAHQTAHRDAHHAAPSSQQHSHDGAGLNGAHTNGAHLNGVHLNGSSPNGSSLNGSSLNGSLLNGAHPNGYHPHDAPLLAGASLRVAHTPATAAAAAAGAQLDGPAPANGAAPVNGAGLAPAAATAAASATSAAPGESAAAAAPAPAAPDSSIPGSIWILCCISAALTCASCVFNTALPIYMVSELKMSMRSMGMFEGLLEAFSYVVRMCSGVVSDRMTSRKAAITLGFAAGAAAKFGMASAGTVGLLFAGKAVDRLANGIQAAPRDALIGDLSPPGARSACFGLAQSLRKWGSAVGALAAFFLMKASNNNYQLIFYSAAAVSLTATAAFVAFVPAHTRATTNAAQQQQRQHQPASAALAHQAAPAHAPSHATATASGSGAAKAAAAAPSGPLSGVREFAASVAGMGADFFRMLGVISLYALGHINESLLEARAMEVGFGKAEATLVVAALAAVTFLTAYPLGRLDDRFGAGTTFAVGIGSLIAGDLVLLLSGPHPWALFAACAFLGVHWAVIQGPLLSIVSGLAPPALRGTAFGIFYTVMAFTAVAANTMYGSIWHTYGANAAFATSAGLMSLVLAALPHLLPASARKGAAAPAPAAPAAAAAAPAPVSGGGGAAGLMAVPLPAAA